MLLQINDKQFGFIGANRPPGDCPYFMQYENKDFPKSKSRALKFGIQSMWEAE